MALHESPGKGGLEDDWEEVTDNYSIVSLPTSDDESTEILSPDHRPSCSSDTKSSFSSQPSQSDDDPTSTQGCSVDFSGSKQTSMLSYKTTVEHRSCPYSRNSFDAFGQTSFARKNMQEITRRMGASGTISGGQGTLNQLSSQPEHTESSPVQIPHRKPSTNDTFGLQWEQESITPGQPRPDLAVPYRGLTFATEDSMETTNATIFRVDSPTLEAQSSSPRRGTIGESLDLEESSINPVLINNNLRALEQTLTETSDLTAKSRTYPDYATKIYTSCQDLTLQVNELLPILGEYADQWERPSTAARDIPLDPSLQLWIASLTRILSELGKIHKALDSAGDRTKDIELENSFATFVDALSDHYRQMNDFLPIMQIDFNDYKTKYMSFPSPTIAERITGPRHNYQVSNMGTDQIYCIRRAVYALKDELQRTILVLEASLSCLSDIRLIAVTDVITAVRRVFDAVSQALTNNGSEWIENDLKHGNRQLLS